MNIEPAAPLPSKPLFLCELTEPGLPGVETFSPACLKVRRALAFARLDYTSRRADRPDAFRKLNPTGQVPVLLVGDEIVPDSTRILTRLQELAPTVFNIGLDARGLAEARLWEELADTTLNGFVVAARWADDRNWPRVRDAYFARGPWFVRALIAPRIRAKIVRGLEARDVWRAGAAACWDRFESTLDDLEARAPESWFWLGASLSTADLAIFGQLHALRTPLTPWQSERLAARPRLSALLDRIDAETRPIPRATP